MKQHARYALVKQKIVSGQAHHTETVYNINLMFALKRDIRIRAEDCSPVKNTVTVCNGGDITLENNREYNETDALNIPVYKTGSLKQQWSWVTQVILYRAVPVLHSN